MTRKRIDLNTCVWGRWHLEVMRHAMLPTLLSPGNVPALADRFSVRYRIATTLADRRQIEEWPIFKCLAEAIEVEWLTETSAPDITYHIERYRRSLSEAKAANAYCFTVYPDVAWSDGVIARCADALARGKAGVAIPYIRVIGETFVPDMAARTADRVIELQGGELVRLGMRHLHPLSAATIAGGRHALPALEAMWRVPEQGVLVREMSRELSMIDPERLQANQFWNAVAADLGSVHVGTDSDAMLMLSVAPLFKDLQAYIPDHALQPMDLARISLHPDNNNPFIEYFASQPIKLHYDGFDPNRWRKAERDADQFVGQALFMRGYLGVWSAVRAAGCSLAAQAMSVGLLGTQLASRWQWSGPMTIFVPTDEAFDEKGRQALISLLQPEHAPALQRALLDHVVPGVVGVASGTWREAALGGASLRGSGDSYGDLVNEARIVRRLDVPPYQICLIDRCLAPIQVEVAAAGRHSSDPRAGTEESSVWRSLRVLAQGLRTASAAVAEKIHPFKDDEGIARHYSDFLRHFGLTLDGRQAERQRRAAATALYQAGLYRQKLLFFHDLTEQFEALRGPTDPRPAFLDHCSSLVGGERELMQAERYYRLALRLVPDFAEALYALARLKRRAHMMREARQLFEAAAQAQPHPRAMPYAHISANSWRNVAEMHRELGDHRTAEACFRKALEKYGTLGAYQAQAADLLRTQGHIGDAVPQYELSMPYSHLYPCEFTEPGYASEETLPAGMDGKPCDPLKPNLVAEQADGLRLVYWWHVYLPMPTLTLDPALILKLRPKARLP